MRGNGNVEAEAEAETIERIKGKKLFGFENQIMSICIWRAPAMNTWITLHSAEFSTYTIHNIQVNQEKVKKKFYRTSRVMWRELKCCGRHVESWKRNRWQLSQLYSHMKWIEYILPKFANNIYFTLPNRIYTKME